MLEQIFFATSAVGTIFNFVRLCSTAIILDYVPILYEIGYLQVGIKVKDCNDLINSLSYLSNYYLPY